MASSHHSPITDYGSVWRTYACHFKFGLDRLLPQEIEFVHMVPVARYVCYLWGALMLA